MFLRHYRFTITKMADNNSRNVGILLNKLSCFERTISTLQSEVTEMRKILLSIQDDSKFPKSVFPKFVIKSSTKYSSNVTPAPKKRKLSYRRENDETDTPSLTPAGNFIIDGKGFVQVFTDGACENNGRNNARAGVGVWFGHNHPLNLAEPVKRRPTNNVGEIEACTRAIQQAHSKGVTKLCINTDSEFTINCITKWIHGWKKKNWINASGKPVINKDELIELDNTIKLIENVKWNHVRGHNGIEGNEAADELARKGATMYKAH